jgi:hypothetical protein
MGGSGEAVTLADHGGIAAMVEGLSAAGYLCTRATAPPHTRYEHQPDGNSFDMMRNMIVRKAAPAPVL